VGGWSLRGRTLFDYNKPEQFEGCLPVEIVAIRKSLSPCQIQMEEQVISENLRLVYELQQQKKTNDICG
jgi:folate-dependent tRNA-U54 methylase TrmFO/GidA